MKKMTKISTVIASLLVVGAANAATPGAYVGVGAGASILRTPNYFGSPNIAGVSTSDKRGGLGGRAFVGYNFTNYFGIEAGYAAYAKSLAKLSVFGQDVSIKNQLNALRVVGKGYLPLNDTGLNAYVLGGVAAVRSELSVHGTNNQELTNKTTRAYRPTYGIGMSYDTADHVTTSVELSRIEGKGNMNRSTTAIPNADMVSFNVGYNFG